MSHIRPAAVAGLFYPGKSGDLAATVRELLDAARKPHRRQPRAKAIIAPHAGYIYSGPIAASAYACLLPYAGEIRRVVLIGPCHRVALRGIGASGADAFETPLGSVPVDTAAVHDLLSLPQVLLFEATHEQEHALEVHLPFLQEILGAFSIVPLVVGEAGAGEVEEVLERLWGGPETLIVVSSDLSHYLDYASARELDGSTVRAIETLAADHIGAGQACGRVPMRGLLRLARRRGLTVTTLDVRNSGDTAGDRRRVVGYGAWLFSEPAAAAADDSDDEERALRDLVSRHGDAMLALARASIVRGLEAGRPPAVATATLDGALCADGASFVTLRRDGRLRGCIGSSEAYRPLGEDIAHNAYAAAFADRRFPPVDRAELDDLAISVSVLSEPTPLRFADERDLLARLRPGRDGLIIEAGDCRALFLPQVWATIGARSTFLAQLKLKAGLAEDAWPEDLRAWRFGAVSVPATEPPPAR